MSVQSIMKHFIANKLIIALDMSLAIILRLGNKGTWRKRNIKFIKPFIHHSPFPFSKHRVIERKCNYIFFYNYK